MGHHEVAADIFQTASLRQDKSPPCGKPGSWPAQTPQRI